MIYTRLFRLSLVLLVLPIVYGMDFGYHDGAMWHDDGLVYDQWGDSIRVRKGHLPLYDMSFSMTSIGLTPSMNTGDFNWEWEHYNYSFDWDYINGTLPFFKNNDTNWVNSTRETYIFTGRNHDPINNWTIELNFTEGQNIKIKPIVTVGGLMLVSPKFKFRFDYYDTYDIKYNNQLTNAFSNIPIDISPSLSALPTRMEVYGLSDFLFQDLVDTGNIISSVYIGNGYSTIETKPPNLIYYRGDVIELDPQSTGYIAPTDCGDPLNQWANCNNTHSDNGFYAEETTVGHMMDIYRYGFGVDVAAEVTFVSVRLYSNAGDCVE